jgi:hypothetical protein
MIHAHTYSHACMHYLADMALNIRQYAAGCKTRCINRQNERHNASEIRVCEKTGAKKLFSVSKVL